MKRKFINPEIKEYRVRTESMIAASKGSTIITPVDPEKWYVGQLENMCTKDGAAQSLAINEYECYRVNKIDATSCNLIYILGAKQNDYIKVTRLNETDFRAEIVPSDCGNGTVIDTF